MQTFRSSGTATDILLQLVEFLAGAPVGTDQAFATDERLWRFVKIDNERIRLTNYKFAVGYRIGNQEFDAKGQPRDCDDL